MPHVKELKSNSAITDVAKFPSERKNREGSQVAVAREKARWRIANGATVSSIPGDNAFSRELVYKKVQIRWKFEVEERNRELHSRRWSAVSPFLKYPPLSPFPSFFPSPPCHSTHPPSFWEPECVRLCAAVSVRGTRREREHRLRARF